LALVAGEPPIGWGISGGGATFLAWAIARELHPDRPWVATVAALAAPLGLLLARPDLWNCALVLLFSRAIAGTTGRGMRPADVILFGVVGALAGWRDPGPVTLAVGVVGLVLTAVWVARGRTEAVVTAGLFGMGAALAALAADPLAPSTRSWTVVMIGLVIGLTALIGPDRIMVGTDRVGGRVESVRVRTARAGALLAATAVHPLADPGVMFPVWAALAAVVLHPR
jgi:hypothetical protein